MDAGDRKRKPEEQDGDAADGLAKKPRLEDNGAANGAGTAKTAATISVLEKAKLALAKQKELKEKLAKLQTAKAAALAAVPSKPTTILPPPLIVDEQGREISTTTTGQQQQPLQQKQTLDLTTAQEPPEQDEFYDPFLGSKDFKRLNRRARSDFHFVEKGSFEKAAEITRLKSTYGDKHIKDIEDRRKREDEMAADKMDVNAIPLGTRQDQAAPEEPIPDVEWWDARILVDKTTYGDDVLNGGDVDTSQIKKERINNLVEHPIPIEPPLEAPPPPPQPLKLTKKEMKKLRTQRRLAREQEKQDLIRQGLLEPPKPKVKISNLMRVLGSEAAADPTAIEKEVQRQMAERLAAHQDRNLANMLTPAERREKKLRKILDAEGAETHVGVYKIKDLSKPQLKFKVEINARENHMTGVVVKASDFCLVVVEGGPKTLRRYDKLMMERIQWNKQDDDEEEEEDAGDNDMETDGGNNTNKKEPNYCHKVWSGVVKTPSFRRFKTETVMTMASGRQIFVTAGVPHYWDLAVEYQPPQ